MLEGVSLLKNIVSIKGDGMDLGMDLLGQLQMPRWSIVIQKGRRTQMESSRNLDSKNRDDE